MNSPIKGRLLDAIVLLDEVSKRGFTKHVFTKEYYIESHQNI